MARGSKRSASEPAGSPAASIAIACTAANKPARAGDPVIVKMASG
jgi:hypothetical protein